MPSPFQPTHLTPSKLGTKEYWDTTYTTDLSHLSSSTSNVTDNNNTTTTHTGHDWFSDSHASSKIFSYLHSPELGLDRQKTSFLDLGCGNGEMVGVLRGWSGGEVGEDEGEEGGEGGDDGGGGGGGGGRRFRGRIVGVDYSAAGVEFARRRRWGEGGKKSRRRRDDKQTEGMREKGVGAEENEEDVEFEVWDIIRDNSPEGWKEGWDVVLDKGTFDAISLSPSLDATGRRLCESYRAKVEVLIKEGGYFVVTSCNWTEEELKGWFEGGELEVFGRVEYPVFRFGGQTGQSISTVCFKKKKS